VAASERGAVRPTTHLPTITPTLTTDAASLPTAAVSPDNTSIASTKGCCCCDCRRSAGIGSVGVGRGRAVRVGPTPATALQPNGTAGGARGHVHNAQLHRVVQGEEGGGGGGGRHACHSATTATNTATTSTRGHGHGHRGLTGGQGPATHRQQGRGGRQEQQATAAAISTAAPQSQHAAAHT
jgi:hypothetical protein